jgi:hypothetical protein
MFSMRTQVTGRRALLGGGTAVAVSERDMMAACETLAADEGLFVAPEGGACVAALKTLRQSGFLSKSDRILIYNTGSGYKYLEAWASHFGATLPETGALFGAQPQGRVSNPPGVGAKDISPQTTESAAAHSRDHNRADEQQGGHERGAADDKQVRNHRADHRRDQERCAVEGEARDEQGDGGSDFDGAGDIAEPLAHANRVEGGDHRFHARELGTARHQKHRRHEDLQPPEEEGPDATATAACVPVTCCHY